jgi:hypothetical protein
MADPVRTLKHRQFSVEVMNRVWDMSNGDYKKIIERQQEMETAWRESVEKAVKIGKASWGRAIKK